MFVSIFPFSKRQQKYRLVTSRILTSCFSPTMAARPYHGFSMTRSLRIAMVRVINLFTNFERCSVMSRLSLFCALYAAFPPFLRWTVLHDPLRGIRNLGKNINSCSWGGSLRSYCQRVVPRLTKYLFQCNIRATTLQIDLFEAFCRTNEPIVNNKNERKENYEIFSVAVWWYLYTKCFLALALWFWPLFNSH